ncbi:MAG: hypothetical protein B7Z80_18100 [Rhodospirillales bacterium 20-64-7]|nr:MAG: hypothetical protein B7Z80_18100 [Rhodospirillales bacterium 20-64-7]
MRLLELIEGSDGKLDEQPLLSIIGVLTFLGLCVHGQLTHTPFDAQGFGIGFGAVMGATLAGLGFRGRKDG